ncbi:M20 family metallo-hydrolase [Nanobdella aerobiophila]|nr:M20 family metallo-hydrolase [Nanobdella aerobiophila]
MNIENYKNYIIDLYKQFIPIKSIGPDNNGEGEWARARLLYDIVKELFDDIKLIEVPDSRVKENSRPNIVAIKYGKNRNKTFWLIAHIDTVPVGDINLWKYDPFNVTIEGDILYGRGVQDNGNAIILGILLAKILEDNNIIPDINFGFILSSDEETGSRYGLNYIVNNYPDIFKKEDYILVPDAGSSDGLNIEIAEKGILWLKFNIVGKQAHASNPGLGLNSTRLGSILLLELDKVLHQKYNNVNKIFNPDISTFEPTKVEKNIDNINTIPGNYTFYFDCRILPDYNIDEVLETIKFVVKEFENNYNCKVEMNIVMKDYPSILNNIDNNDFLNKIKDLIKKYRNKEARIVGIGGGTYAKILREKGYNAIVWSTYNESAHMPNEYININDLIIDTKILLEILKP